MININNLYFIDFIDLIYNKFVNIKTKMLSRKLKKSKQKLNPCSIEMFLSSLRKLS